MRGGERTEGPLNEERGDGMGDGLLQSQSVANLHLKRAKNRVDVAKGGIADGVALTGTLASSSYQCIQELGCPAEQAKTS
jgi:hypothetical protein